MFVLIARVTEAIIEPAATRRTPAPAFTLPIAKNLAHPIPEDVVRTVRFGFEDKNRSTC
jgi:hypothetical protein